MPERHMPLARLAEAIRGDGFQVIIRPGAQGKSARNFATIGYYMGCQATVEHHTVSSGLNPLNDVGYIESGKGVGYVIANAYTALDGTIWLIASGPTYTEGTGGPWGIIPRNRAVDVCFSNEIASWGAEGSVYPRAQQDAAASLAYHAGLIAADVWDWPDDPFSRYRNFAHFEWTDASPETFGRKVDPRGISRWSPNGGRWNMDAFRNELTTRNSNQENDMRTLPKPRRAYDSRSHGGPWSGAETRTIDLGTGITKAFINVTVIGQFGSAGFISVNDPNGNTSLVNYSGADAIEANSAPVLASNGKITVTNIGGYAHVVIDVYEQLP